MFLGNIEVKRPQITGSYDDNAPTDSTNMVHAIRSNTTVRPSYRKCCFPITMNSATYKWGNSLDAKIFNETFYSDSDNTTNPDTKESTNVAGFKCGDHYRLGLQFQYKTGKWSQPVFIDDYIMGDMVINENTVSATRPSLDILSGFNQYVQTIPTFNATIAQTIGQQLLDKGYKRVRAVVCFPTESDQLILCQGLLNPTVHSIAGRVNHTPDV